MDYNVSVVIPTYNRQNVLRESVNSVLNQTYPPFEIIIVDDNSTDNTEGFVKEYYGDRVVFIKNKFSKGANGARNTGIVHAKGDLISFHDSDDIWFENKLEKQIDTFSKNDLDLVFCSMKKGDELVPNIKVDTDKISLQIQKGNLVSTQTILLKANLAKENLFDERVKRLQDWDFVLTLIEKNIKIGYCRDVLVEQMLSPDSISNSQSFYDSYKYILDKHYYLRKIGFNNKIVFLKCKEKKNIVDLFFLFLYRCIRYFK
ncbi:glycosyltransferase family 2 protein [Brenneria sp. g21c3]|uniref:glycosyltransferase family 2 protein n=1 Tax=Brenneria sp. g21c3 TaxID=3093893 RepID=UPI002EB00957|nr:glycosyltransferase family 2 protein [Brenneria sp. g21c3]